MDKYYSNNELDINEFNKTFEEKQKQNKKENELEAMNKIIENQQLHDMSLGDIFINMKEEIFGIIYDIFSINFNSFDTFSEIFTKNNRLFYIGIFLIIICIFLYIISYLFFYPKKKQKDININANLSVPNDYKFRYYPYNKQDASEIIESRKTIVSLKKKLLNSTDNIKKMQNEINQLQKINMLSKEIKSKVQKIDSNRISKKIKSKTNNNLSDF